MKQIAKKIVSSTCLLIVSNSFSFRPLNEIYYNEFVGHITYVAHKIDSIQKVRKDVQSNKVYYTDQTNNPDESNSNKIDSVQKLGKEIKSDDWFYLYDEPTSLLLHLKEKETSNITRSNIIDEFEADEEETTSNIVELFPSNELENLIEYVDDFNYGRVFPLQTSMLLTSENKKKEPVYKIEYLRSAIKTPFSPKVLKVREGTTTLSGVEIRNTKEGVTLSKGKKRISLQTALKLYGEDCFDTAIRELTESIITQRGDISKKEVVHKLAQRENVPLEKSELNHLNRCEILSVTHVVCRKTPPYVLGKEKEGNRQKTVYVQHGSFYTLEETSGQSRQHGMFNIFDFDKQATFIDRYTKFIEKDKLKSLLKQETILIGLARNNRTGKIFPWITDLKQDLSVLMKYAVESY